MLLLLHQQLLLLLFHHVLLQLVLELLHLPPRDDLVPRQAREIGRVQIVDA
jgi:hypothetical protein